MKFSNDQMQCKSPHLLRQNLDVGHIIICGIMFLSRFELSHMLNAMYTNTDAHEYHQTSGNFGNYFAIHCRLQRQKYLAYI